MSDNAQMDAIKRYARLIEKQTGKAVRPYRMDGYVNLMNRYGTSKDPSEHYNFQREPDIPDDVLTTIYEGNGLFAKIIDTPAEEAIKHGFTLKDVSDKAVEEFVTEALDELDWEELAMTAIRWTRLFGGAIAVMLINDGGRLEDPLNWRKIKSIDDIRVYERVVVQPEYESMFNYDPTDPFSTRGSRLGMPEYYQVCSRYGNFRVHDSRCLVFQNGVLPENATNSLYRLWGIPEYIRIHRALKDAELAHESAPKLLDRSVQAIYKMKGLSQLMATEQGESQVLRRLQVIDMARGMLNSLVIDSEGEDYDFKTFQFNGITDVVSASCNMLSAITSIPQTILFGQGVGGLSTTDDTSMENYYNYIERIQKRMLRKNLRYLLSIIFQAGLYTGEVDEVPKLNVEFNPLWSLNDTEQATLEQQKAATELTKAQTAQAYIQMEAIDPSEVRKGLADSDEFDVETLLDELDDGEEDLFSDMPDMEGGAGSQNPVETQPQGGSVPENGQPADYAEGVDVKEHDTDPGKNGSPTPASAPAATKLPQDMSDEEKLKAAEAPTNPDKKPDINAQGDGNTTSLPDDEKAGVGVLVLKDGKVLVGTRESESGYGLICGPGGHIKVGETPTQAAFRETEEEFGISPTELIPIGRGPAEPDTGIKPYVFLCTEYHGDLHCVDGEMKDPKFLSLDEIEQLKPSLFQPFADDVALVKAIANGEAEPDGFAPFDEDGGPGSGNHGHKGVEGQVGGSAPSGDDPLTARGPIKDRLKKLGHSQESIDRARALFEKHSGNSGSDQAEADAEIAKHISDDDDIGKMLKDKAQMESQVWRDQIADANVKAKQHYEEELDDIRQMIQPGGALSNYTEDDLKDLGMWPKEPEATEPKFYRKGGMDKDVLAFTTDPNGANMSHLTNGESGSIGSDQQFTIDQMKEMGYLPIAGIQSMDVGQVGESEVLFAKFPSSKAHVAPYAGETSHGLDESVYSAKKSEWSKNAGRELSDREVQEMVDATSDYTRNYKDVVAASAGYSGVYATRGSLMDSEEKATAEKSAAAIEKAISLSDKYAGTTKRAMTMDKDAFDKFIAESSGDSTFGLGHLSSWSTGDDALKRVFRSRDGDDPDSYNVVLECKSKSGVSIKDVADVDMDEVLYSKKARFKVLDTDPDYSVGKYKAVKLTLEEVGNRGDSSDLDGGPGSGNHGHEGVPGEVGGSAPSASSLNDSIRNASKNGYMEVDKQVRSTLKDVPVGTKFTQKGVKYTKTAENEFTADNGRKATANAIANGIDISSEASIPKFEDVKSSDIAAQKLENGELSAKKAAELVPPASSEQIKQWISDPQFQRSVKAGTDPKVTAEFESFIAKQKDFNGEAYRGVGFENTAFVDSLKAGDPIDMNGISSWSKFQDVASDYSLGWDEKPVGVVFRVKNPKGSAELSESGEGEILLSGKSKLRVKKVSKVSDDGDYIVDVENCDGGHGSGNFGHEGRSGEQVFYDEKDE